MSHKQPSQLQIVLLLTASALAGLIVSTTITRREATPDHEPPPFSMQSLIAESP